MHIEDRSVKPAVSPALKAFLSATNNTTVDDGWGVHGLWTPGVRIMRNLNFTFKALLVSALFLLPVLIFSYSFLSNQIDQISFSTKEVVGVSVMKKLMPVYSQPP